MGTKSKNSTIVEQPVLLFDFDASSLKSRDWHSNRIPKQQKIKNIGVLDKKPIVDDKSDVVSIDSEQYFEKEFAKPQAQAIDEVFQMLVQVERFQGAPFLAGEAFARQFKEALQKRQCLPNPILFRAKERGSFLAPLHWYFAPERMEADTVAALQRISQQRNFPKLNICFSEVNDSIDPLAWLENLGKALDSHCTFVDKPYPVLHAICAVDHPCMSEFLRKKNPSQKSRWRRSAGVLYTRGFREQSDVYQSMSRELWESLIGNTDIHTLYFRRDPRFSNELRYYDGDWATLNLAAFVDPFTKKFRWAELRQTARLLQQLFLLWQESSQPQVVVREAFPVGLCGWGSALLKLGLDFESDTSFLLARRLSMRLAELVNENRKSIAASLGASKNITPISFQPRYDTRAAAILETSVGVGPIAAKGDAFSGLAMHAALAGDTDITQQIAAVPRLRRRSEQEFTKLCNTAAALGFLGVRFFR